MSKPKKKFKDTKVGSFLFSKLPGLIGDILPDKGALGILKNIIDTDPDTTPEEKKQVTKATVIKIINKKTWWNVFTHYKHGVVYEVRIASGEGIRWKKNKLELIGFLEPFV